MRSCGLHVHYSAKGLHFSAFISYMIISMIRIRNRKSMASSAVWNMKALTGCSPEGELSLQMYVTYSTSLKYNLVARL